MAFGMKSWLLTTLAGIGVALVLLLPPGHASDILPEGFRAREAAIRPAADRLVRLEVDLRSLATPLLAIRLEPWVRERLEEEGEPGRLVVVGLESVDGTADELRALRERAAELGRSVEVTGGEGAPVLALLITETGAHVPAPADRAVGTHYYAGTLDDGTPYCARVLYGAGTGLNAYTVEREMWTRTPDRMPLRQCELWARYGAPGDDVRAWFDAGGYELAYAGTPPMRDDLTPRGLGRNVLRATATSRPERMKVIQRCLAGDRSRCAGLLAPRLAPEGGGEADLPPVAGGGPVDPDGAAEGETRSEVRDRFRALVLETDLTVAGASRGPFSLAWFERGMIAALEEEGADRFRAFWTSDEPLDVAFEEAFGVPPGEWVHGWLAELFGPDVGEGPTIALADLGLSLAVLLALLGTAVVTHRRRRIA